MVAPGASNWNEIFPNVDRPRWRTSGASSTKERAAHVLGLFQTVWHDDGETLYEATWYPVIYAAAAAWQAGDVAPDRFANDFPSAFFGVDDREPRLPTSATSAPRSRQLEPRDYSYGQTDALFWADPFDSGAGTSGRRKPIYAQVRLCGRTGRAGSRILAGLPCTPTRRS